ncbi:hypothetical protein SDC9_136480 [bioreactor metagenome]|uniref:Uncharacterized protein n=1 Tax=bioreactor metagenome TaxID=1076179 RepID=A0A645DJE3_9ZZZZ
MPGLIQTNSFQLSSYISWGLRVSHEWHAHRNESLYRSRLLSWKLHRALQSIGKAYCHLARRAIFDGIAGFAAEGAAATVAHKRRRNGVAIHHPQRGMENSIAILFVAENLHEQGITLHINSKTATRLAIQFFGDDPSACLRREIACRPARIT